MAMDKKLRIGLIVVAVAIVAYLTWKWWLGRQSTIQSPTQSFGTNLNSVAPELVGGSAGPSVGSAPAVSLPVSINISDPVHGSVELQDSDQDGIASIPTGRSFQRLQSQRHAAGVVSGPDQDIPAPDESMGSRGMSDAEQDSLDEPDMSAVNAPMYGTGGM